MHVGAKRASARFVVQCCAALVLVACNHLPHGDAVITFKRDGKVVAARSLTALTKHFPLRKVETRDPYYHAHKRFRALPLNALLSAVYQTTSAWLRKQSFVLYALDGYAVPITGEKLLDGSAYLALDDLDVPGFAPIGPRQESPAPCYLIWEGNEHTNLATHPRPWQLTTIAIVDPKTLYPHTRPTGEPADGEAMHGYRIFHQRCIRCHAINREGGRLGPDLNVPQSIVAYRPEAQIRAYIQNPLTFRYGAMPANPDLTDDELNALLAYFRAMSAQPYDPEPKSLHD